MDKPLYSLAVSGGSAMSAPKHDSRHPWGVPSLLPKATSNQITKEMAAVSSEIHLRVPEKEIEQRSEIILVSCGRLGMYLKNGITDCPTL